MILRALNFMLLAAALVGVYFALKAEVEYRPLREYHRQLVAEVGLLPVGDPAKVHIVAIPTGEPLHYAWQMYVPAGYEKQWHSRAGHGSSSSSGGSDSEPHFDVVRVRLREQSPGNWQVWTKQRNSSSLMGFSADELKKFGPLESLQAAPLAADGVVVLEPDEVATLLRLPKTGEPLLVEVRFGSREGFRLDAARKAAAE